MNFLWYPKEFSRAHWSRALVDESMDHIKTVATCYATRGNFHRTVLKKLSLLFLLNRKVELYNFAWKSYSITKHVKMSPNPNQFKSFCSFQASLKISQWTKRTWTDFQDGNFFLLVVSNIISWRGCLFRTLKNTSLPTFHKLVFFSPQLFLTCFSTFLHNYENLSQMTTAATVFPPKCTGFHSLDDVYSKSPPFLRAAACSVNGQNFIIQE